MKKTNALLNYIYAQRWCNFKEDIINGNVKSVVLESAPALVAVVAVAALPPYSVEVSPRTEEILPLIYSHNFDTVLR